MYTYFLKNPKSIMTFWGLQNVNPSVLGPAALERVLLAATRDPIGYTH